MLKKDLAQTKKILIIMMGGIGNMIFLTPALKALRKAFPSSEMVFLLGPYGAEKVIENSPLFNKKFIIKSKTYQGISGKIKLIRQLRKEHIDLSFTSTGSNPLKSGLLCLLSGIKYRLGENIKGRGIFYNLKIPFNPISHEVEGNIRLVEKLGIEVPERTLSIHYSKDDDLYAKRFFTEHGLNRTIVVGFHPGSGIHQAEFRRWPAENFALLADKIIDEFKTTILLFGGLEEFELSEKIKSQMRNKPLVLTGTTTLAQTAALIKKCRLFLSNDSGLQHVACAVDTPTVSIWGPTNPQRTGPYSDSSIVVRKDLLCSPCYKGKAVQCDHLDCFRLISVEEVFIQIEEQLLKYGQ